MIYTYHERIDGDVKTTTIHGTTEQLVVTGELLRQYYRYADIYVGEDCIIVRERVA